MPLCELLRRSAALEGSAGSGELRCREPASSSSTGQPEVKLGVIPGFGGTQRLVRRVGRSAALDLCLTGRMIGAEEALRMGLASRQVEGDVVEAALAIAEEMAGLGPVALAYAKRAIHDHADGSLEAGLAAERTLFGMCFATEDQSEGMRAFLEKRAPEFKGG